ncbi:Peptidase C39, ABC-type bacteriocin transporter [[Mycoplasma] cavipharyngis]|uniref:cysteine peptidase family C39 domain-containing protein n=1 Tax=[Mycoplasma] cavipharyngis TaxID=92757 RepID=UPI003703B85D
MKIYRQQEIFDCGICVTQSLINFFYHKEISREELISNAKLTQSGMSILDLEEMNKKYGICLDSYELSFDDFVNYQTKDYFILLLNFPSGNHYVIAKKNNNEITIYDSLSGKRKISYQQLKEYYANIFIEIKKQKNNAKLLNVYIERKININWIALIKIFIINIIVLALTIISGYFIKTIFNNVIGSNDISNLGTIVFIAVFGYLANGFGNFMIEILETNQRKNYYKNLSNDLLNHLANKNNDFFHKVSQHQFVLLNYHIEVISKYYSRYYHSFLIHLISVLYLSTFIAILDWRIILIIIGSLLTQICYTFFAYQFNKKQYPKIKFLEDKSKENYFELKRFFNEEINQNKLIHLLKGIKNNTAMLSIFDYKWTLSNGCFEKINAFVTNLINLMLYAFGAYLLIKNQIQFGSLIVITTFYGYINTSFSKLVDFYFYTIDFNFSQKVYLNFLNVANQKKDGLDWEKINEIKVEKLSYYCDGKRIFQNLNLKIKNNCFIQGPSGSGKSTLYGLLCQKLKPTIGNIKFNDIDINFFHPQKFNANVIYQKNISYIPDFSWSKIFQNITNDEKKLIITVCELMNLELKDNLKIQNISSGQAQFINLVLLLQLKNKLIILDEATSHIDKKIKNIIFQTLIDKIAQNNFLICTEHDLAIADFFKQKIIIKGD